MRTIGKITKWNRDKGYGFITPDSGAKQVFVHVSALRNRAWPPQVGQLVTFTLSEDSQGRPCAVDVARDGEPAPRVQRRRADRPRRFGSGMTLIGLIFLAAAAGWYKLQFARTPGTTVHGLSAPAAARPAAPQFRCDGRTRCSEMTSCAEAKYFIRNCPNTQMDGDGDGVPCESQWCG